MRSREISKLQHMGLKVSVTSEIWQVPTGCLISEHDNVIKWKHFPRYWPLVRGIHKSPVNSPHKGQWRGALILVLICACPSGWGNSREAGDLRRHRAQYDIIVMATWSLKYPIRRLRLFETVRDILMKRLMEAQDNTMAPIVTAYILLL